MKTRILFASLLAIFVSSAANMLAASSGAATLAYQKRVQSIVTQRVLAALIPRFAQLQRAGSGAVGVRFRVLVTGQVESVTITQRHPAGFVNSTCSHVISSAKFPPIPTKVIHEQGHAYVDVTSEIRVN
jgi:outer membrane biosynthesis protein TonB